MDWTFWKSGSPLPLLGFEPRIRSLVAKQTELHWFIPSYLFPWTFDLVDEGTTLHRNVGKYSPFDIPEGLKNLNRCGLKFIL